MTRFDAVLSVVFDLYCTGSRSGSVRWTRRVKLRVVPMPAVTMVIQLGEPFRGLPQVFLSDLSTGPSRAEPGASVECVDLSCWRV